MTAYRQVVVGAGIAGLGTALYGAARGPVLLLVPRAFGPRVPERIDAVPLAAIATLIDLGIDPRNFSDLVRHSQRLAAWSSKEPVGISGREVVHVRRAALEAALLARVVRLPAVTVAPAPADRRELRALAATWSARGVTLVDASGRAAVLAARRDVLRGAWHARVMQQRTSAGQEFSAPRLAAHEGGYAYRLGCAGLITVGLVSFRCTASAVVPCWRRLRREHPFLFEGLDAQDERPIRGYPAGLQSAQHAGSLAVGDAGLARDALASQGIAAALSEAAYAAAVETAAERRLYALRMVEQRRAHARSLHLALADAWPSSLPAWCEYRGEVGRLLTDSAEPPVRVALREGRVRPLAAPAATGS
ncbi:MAG: hypothetical protein JSR73_08445 [Proteobacteria bacterium]|nr:hypothetical protein [Pseudomonadota bacterium]